MEPNKTADVKQYDETADVIYGVICCLCFVVGTVGNISSFICFRSKKKEISTVIYMMTAVNDIIISIAVLPVGISFLTKREKREKGFLFENEYCRLVWYYMWEIAVVVSIFLVICISISRTLSLLRPFMKQNVKYLFFAVVTYLTLETATLVGLHILGVTKIEFYPKMARPVLGLNEGANINNHTGGKIVDAISTITYVVPAIVVIISCIISAVLLTKGNKRIQQMQTQAQAIKNRVTVTILLFALVYGICNVPLAIRYLLQTCALYTNGSWFDDIFAFDTQFFFTNAIYTLLVAVNSAANPILYIWRMPSLRQYTIAGIKRSMKLTRETRIPPHPVKLEMEPQARIIRNRAAIEPTVPDSRI